MRAIVVEEPGGSEVLKLRNDVEVPELKPDHVLIKVAYAGLNFFDVLMRGGRYLRKPRYPVIPGGEVSGVVAKVGSDVTHLVPGQPVFALTGSNGGYAEYVSAPIEATLPMPPIMSMKLGAAYPLQVLTAWGVLNASGGAKPGEWVLVHAAAGGVGTVLCQMARDRGCMVIGTAGSDEKCEHAKKFGAQWVINYNEEQFHKRVRQITGGHGVDLICDSVGAATQIGNMRCIANFGRVVIFGYASGEPKYDMNVLWGRSAGVTTYGLYHHVLHDQLTRRSIRETLPAVINGELKLPIGGVWPLEEVQKAHEAMESRATTGKLLLAVNTGIASLPQDWHYETAPPPTV